MRIALVASFVSLLAVVGPASAASPEVTTFEHAGAAVSGPLEGGEGEFFVALEVFSFTEDGQPAVSVAADAIFGDVECLTDASDASTSFADDLSTATLTGSVTGSCFDFGSEEDSSYTASFDVTWTAMGPVKRTTFTSRGDGQVCVTTVRSREAIAEGTLTWSAPELGLGGTGSPFGRASLESFSTRCVATG